VIPAHNEAGVIDRCMRTLAAAASPGSIVVACNGCTDDTAARARAAGGDRVTVIETEVASKSHALNLGDAAASGFPRFYVDADVILTGEAVAEVAAAMAREPGVLAAAPLIEFDLSDRPWAVRAFYEVWSALPYCRNGMIGSGVYALSEAGRARFGKFPDITADDAYVRLQFQPHERMTVQTCRFTVTPPKTLGGVVKIKTRAYFGDYELRARFPELFANKQDGHGRALVGLLKKPGWWARVAVYLYVRMLSRALGYRRFYFGDHRKWERDDSSRQRVAAAQRTGNQQLTTNNLL
jgi:glycosyltransferase involved in cell wall biosynthesis